MIGGGDLAAATVAYRKARAARELIMLKKLRGELIEAETVDRLLVTRALEFKKALVSLSRRLAPQLVGMDVRTIRERIDDECRKILETYSRE